VIIVIIRSIAHKFNLHSQKVKALAEIKKDIQKDEKFLQKLMTEMNAMLSEFVASKVLQQKPDALAYRKWLQYGWLEDLKKLETAACTGESKASDVCLAVSTWATTADAHRPATDLHEIAPQSCYVMHLALAVKDGYIQTHYVCTSI
jgi:Ni,Fe-hydrogenase I large subunit